jgi:hypothetical protein
LCPFSINTIKAVFGAQISKDITEIKPDQKVESQIKVNVKNNSRKIAKQMTLEEIKNTDLYDFLIKIKTVLDNSGKLKSPSIKS